MSNGLVPNPIGYSPNLIAFGLKFWGCLNRDLLTKRVKSFRFGFNKLRRFGTYIGELVQVRWKSKSLKTIAAIVCKNSKKVRIELESGHYFIFGNCVIAPIFSIWAPWFFASRFLPFYHIDLEHAHRWNTPLAPTFIDLSMISWQWAIITLSCKCLYRLDISLTLNAYYFFSRDLVGVRLIARSDSPSWVVSKDFARDKRRFTLLHSFW